MVEDDLSNIQAEELDPDAPVRGRPRDQQWDVTGVVIVGGILGAEARYGLATAVPHAPYGFPWSTVYINVIGCFGIGILMSLLTQLSSPHRLVRPFIGIGILGGFTTFSTFAVDAQRLIERHRPGVAGMYVLVTVSATAASVAVGTIAARLSGRGVYRRRLRRAEARPRQHGAGVSAPSRGRR